jgi:hypothetical protein
MQNTILGAMHQRKELQGPFPGAPMLLSAEIMEHSGHLVPHHPDITCPLVSLSLM